MVVLEMPPIQNEKAFSVPDGFFSDVIYDLDDAPIIFKFFPEAKFYDATDDIHTSRFAVVLPEEKRDKYFVELVLSKIAMDSITFQLTMKTGDEKGEIKRWLDEAAKYVKLVYIEDDWQAAILRKRYEEDGKEFADVEWWKNGESFSSNRHLVSEMKQYEWKKDNAETETNS